MKKVRRKLARLYPELRRFASREEAGKVVKAWQKQQLRTPRFWFGLVAYTCGAAGVALAILLSIGQWLPIPPSMYGGLVGGFVGGSGAGAMAWFWRRRFTRYLRQQLVARGIPICLKCGYDLRGQTEPRCPECGTAFELSSSDQLAGQGD